VVAATVVFVAATAVRSALAFGPASIGEPADFPTLTLLLAPALILGWLVGLRAPTSPVGPALAWTSALPAVVYAIEEWGASYFTADPWPGSHTAAVVGVGVWPWQFLGFVALVLVFPDGPLPGWRWRLVAIAAPLAALLVNFVVSTDTVNYSDQPSGLQLAGSPPFVLPLPLRIALLCLAFGSFIGVLLAVAASLVTRLRRGDEQTRLRLRWLVCAAVSVPVLLATSWLLIALGVPDTWAYLWFLAAMLVLVPAAIAVAILRHDLFDIDRLLGATLTWLTTSIVSAAVFAGVVVAVDILFPDQQRAGITSAAFITALVLLPLHHWLHRGVSRLVDRDRTVALAQIQEFVRRVRDGRAEPEQIEDVLRMALQDPSLEVLLQRPGDHLDLPSGAIPLQTSGSTVGALVLGLTSARRVRRAREAAMEARLPIEVSRLRLELREALEEVRASRARLMTAVTAERQRLERDLHDGAQQQLIAIGMRLRSLQHHLGPGGPAYGEVDEVVDTVEGTVAELRRIAHGVRPSRLDDGLAVALRRLVQDSAVPVDLSVSELEVDEAVATAVYFTVGEAIANALKHARATRISIEVGLTGGRLRVQVCDDGIGGAREGFGLTSLRDRVASVGGELTLDSPPGSGTSIRAEIPCAS